jgi:hypothetical protein
MASPNNEYRLKTKNRPIIEHKIAIAIPEMIARCIKLNEKISKIIFNDDACVPAWTLQNIV